MQEHYGKTDLNRNHEGSRGQTSPDDGRLTKNMCLLDSKSEKRKKVSTQALMCVMLWFITYIYLVLLTFSNTGLLNPLEFP